MALKTEFAREMCKDFDPVTMEQIAAELMKRSFWIENEIQRLRAEGKRPSELMDLINDISWMRSTAGHIRGCMEGV
jgi:hypothetical protein